MAKTFHGVTEAEAAIKACEALGIGRSQLKYRVLEQTTEPRQVSISVDAAPAHQEDDGIELIDDNEVFLDDFDNFDQLDEPQPEHLAAEYDERFKNGQEDLRASLTIHEKNKMPARHSDRQDRPGARQRRPQAEVKRQNAGAVHGSSRYSHNPRTDRPATGGRQPNRDNRFDRDRGFSSGSRDERGFGRRRDAYQDNAQNQNHRHAANKKRQDYRDLYTEEYQAFKQMIATPEQPIEKRPAIAEDQLSDRAQKALRVTREILRLAGFIATVQVSADTEEDVWIDVYGAEDGLLIGRKGETLQSIQFLVNRIMSKENEAAERVVIDCEGYRYRRQEALKVFATKLGERARAENQVVSISPMSAHDRRIFHLALDGKEGLRTRSRGEGHFKRLLIIPENKAQQDTGAHDLETEHLSTTDDATSDLGDFSELSES